MTTKFSFNITGLFFTDIVSPKTKSNGVYI